MSTPWSGPQIRDTPRIRQRSRSEFVDVEIEQADDAYLDAEIASEMALANLHSRGLEADFERDARLERAERRRAQREQAAERVREDEEEEQETEEETSAGTRDRQRRPAALVRDQEPGVFAAPAQMSWIGDSADDQDEQQSASEPQSLRQAVAEASASEAAESEAAEGADLGESETTQRGEEGLDGDELDRARAVLARDKRQQDAFLVDLERTKRSTLLEYAQGGAEDENNPFAKENAKASRAERMNQVATRHDVMVGHMVSAALYPLKQGADADAVVQVMGTGMAMWCLSPSFRKKVDDKLFGKLQDSIKRGVEKEKASVSEVGAFATQKARDVAGAEGLNLGRSYERFLDAVTMAKTPAKGAGGAGHIPMTAESAAATLMRSADQAYQAMRSGEDVTQVSTQFAELTEDLHTRCAADGVGPRAVNREFRALAAERMRRDPGYAARFVETHAGKIRPCPERDKGGGPTWSQRWQANSGGFLNGAKTPMFTPRAPLGLEDHVVSMGAAIAHDLKSSGAAGKGALEETIAGYNAATQFPEQVLDTDPASAGTPANRVLASHSRGVGMMQAMVDDGFAPAEAHEAFRMAIEGAHSVAGKDKSGPLAQLQGEPGSAQRQNYDRIQQGLVSGASGSGAERRLRPMPGTLAAEGMDVLEASRAAVNEASAGGAGASGQQTDQKPKSDQVSLSQAWDERQRADESRRSREQLTTESPGGRHRMDESADASADASGGDSARGAMQRRRGPAEIHRRLEREREQEQSESEVQAEREAEDPAKVRRDDNVRRSRVRVSRRVRQNQQINAAMVAQGRDVDLAGSMDQMRSDEIAPVPQKDGADKQWEGP